ncbi:MAG: PDZ domain-containing protein [Saprospiraceae bacterium]
MTRLSFQRLAIASALLLFLGTTLSAQERHVFRFKTIDLAERNPCKAFIGVGTSSLSKGLKVDYTVDNTPAEASGILAGDVILELDGVPVGTQSELIRERDKHQPGDAFTLKIQRDGREMVVNARFKECNPEEMKAAENERREMLENRLEEIEERIAEMRLHVLDQLPQMEMSERPILGVYEDDGVNTDGLVIKSVITGKGAEAAGLQEGDVVIRIDGKTVTGSGTLRNALSERKPGERVSVVYLRDGKDIRTEIKLSADRGFFSHKIERDPCKVFIGVYTTSNAFEGRKGARVTGVIDDTPAKESGIQPGDVILALNGQPVSNHTDLLSERNKNKPGDAFTLTVLRDGETMEIDAKFKSCETPGTKPVEEKVQVLTESDKIAPRDQPTDNLLQMEVLDAYPNPTFGPLNINIEAEAVPTIVRILDVTGRAVYTKELPQFGGSFSEQINLFNNRPGNYVISVQQGDKVRTKQIVLMPGA